jgi:NB-ARC domain
MASQAEPAGCVTVCDGDCPRRTCAGRYDRRLHRPVTAFIAPRMIDAHPVMCPRNMKARLVLSDMAERPKGRDAGVVFFVDALGGWLIGLLADAGRKKLTTLVLGSEQERALRSAARAAVRRTAADLRPGNDEQAAQLAAVVSEVFGKPVPGSRLAEHATMLGALQAGIAEQLAVLDDASLTGTGRSSAEVLGVSGTAVAANLTRRLVREIVVRGSWGGPLFPLASQLNDDVTHLQGQRIEEALGELVGEVRQALARVGATSELPRPPVHWRPHPPAPSLGAVARAELISATLTALHHGPAPLVVLTGGPGFGKSVLARLVAAAVDAPSTPHATKGNDEWCPGGVVWLDVGPDPDLSRLLAQQLMDLTGQPAGGRGVEQLAADLGDELAARRCLLVLDDLWPPRARKSDVVGLVLTRIGSVPRLVTTRSAAFLAAELGVRRIDVEEMDPSEAATLLATGLPRQAVENDAAQLGELARRLGRWPLLLALAAAHLRRQVSEGVPLGSALSYLTDRYAAKGVTAFDARHADLLDASDPAQRDRAVAAAVEASTGQLTTDEQARYQELAVFPAGQPIPSSVVADLWAPDLGRYDTDDLLNDLADLSLLSLDWGTRQVRVHDLLLAYLLPADPDQRKAQHGHLLDKWSTPLKIQDSYRIRWYAYHLDTGGDSERLYALITPAWRDRVLAVTGALSDAAADVLRAAEHAARHDNLSQELRCRLIVTALVARVRVLPPLLLAALARLGQLDRALGYTDVLPPGERSVALEYIATALADNDPDQALDIADRVNDPEGKARTLAGIAAALTPINPGLAMDVADRINDPEGKARTLAGIAAALTPINPGLALTAGERITNPAEKDQTLYAIVNDLASRDPNLALAAANQIGDPGGKAQRLAGIAAALTSTDPDRALRLTKEALDIADRIDDPQSKEATLSGIASSLSAADPDQALAIIGRIDDDSVWKEWALTGIVAALPGIAPDRALAAADRFEGLTKVEALSGIAAAMATYDPSQAGVLIDQALAVADRVDALGGKAEALTRIAVALAGIDPQRARRLADQALDTADRIGDAEHKARTLAEIATALIGTDPKRALLAADRIPNGLHHAQALTDIAAAIASTDPSLALAAVNRIRSGYDKARALTGIAPELVGTEPDRMLAAANSIEDDFYKHQALTDVAVALASAAPDLALATADRIGDRFYRTKALANVAAALAATAPDLALAAVDRIGGAAHAEALAEVAAILASTDPGRAGTLTERALAAADVLGKPGGQAPALTSIAAALGDTDLDLALATIDRIGDTFYKAQALGTVAAALAHTDPGRAHTLAEQALATADEIDDGYYKVRAFISIATALAAHDPSHALALADRIGSAFPAATWAKALALARIAATLTRTDPGQAGKLATQALAATEQEDTPALTIEPLALIAAALARTDPRRTRILTDQALAAADNIERQEDKAQALSDIAAALAEAEPDLALATAERIGDPSEAARAFARIATGLADRDPGRAETVADQALTAAGRIDDPAHETQALATIAALLTSNRPKVKARLAHHLDGVIGTNADRTRDLIASLRALDPATGMDAWWQFGQLIVILESSAGHHDLLQAVISATEW